MEIITAKVKKSELVYPEKNKDGSLNGIPFYKTTVTFKENGKNKELSFNDEFAYFDKGSNIKVKYNGQKIKIKEIKYEIPYKVNTLVRAGRKHPNIVIGIFVMVLLWVFVLALNNSLLAILPVGIFFTASGFLNIINFFKMRKVILIKGIIKDIASKYDVSSGTSKNYYVYEYIYDNKKLLHTSFYTGARKNKISTKVNLIYNKASNMIMEKSKRKNLLISGLFSTIVGIIFCILILIIK